MTTAKRHPIQIGVLTAMRASINRVNLNADVNAVVSRNGNGRIGRKMQPSLFQSKAPRVADSDVRQLLQALTNRGWRQGALLMRVFGWNERKLRAIAHATHGQVISGDRGYCLTVEASIADIDAFDARMAGQIAHMQQRRVEVQKVRHAHVDLRQSA